MSEIREFFRHCPACGRRFHIKLVGKKLTGERKDTESIPQDNPGVALSPYVAFASPVVLEENIPLTIDVEDFQYSYRCKACGHVWSEMHEEEHEA